MEEKLSLLFDYQLFEQNPALKSVIDAVHARHERTRLELDALSALNAAGSPEMQLARKDKENTTGI